MSRKPLTINDNLLGGRGDSHQGLIMHRRLLCEIANVKKKELGTLPSREKLEQCSAGGLGVWCGCSHGTQYDAGARDQAITLTLQETSYGHPI